MSKVLSFLKCFIPVLAFVVSLFIFVSCSSEEPFKIGVSQCSQDDWRMKMNDEINREIIFHEDAVVEIRSANDNNQKQIDDINYFVENGFDILIVSPNEAAALTPVIKKVYESGIPVIIFDRNIIGDSYTARIGANDTELGESAAEYAINIFGKEKSNALEIYGLPGSTPAEDRHKGFSEKYLASGGNIVASVPANWNQTDAVRVTDSVLRIHPEINVIYAHNDRMAIGASEVTEQTGRKDIRIIGIDAAPEIGIRAVADSVIDATFLYPTEGHLLVRTALAILKNKPYQRETILPVASAVDLSNADILLLQNESLKEETRKLRILKTKIDDYWAKHSSQTSLFYACIVIIFLLFGVVFLILRTYWQHKKHQRVLLEQNKELEEQRDKERELNDKLQQMTQSKLMFYTNVSHDLRTPLTLISEPVAQLAAADNLTEQQHTLIKIADKNVRILRRLINQILDFRKYENDKISLNLTETDLGKAIEDWMESFLSLARKRNIKLSLVNESTEPIVTAVDTEKIERVFFNLISNAFKYTRDNGQIAVTCSTSDNNVKIIVADTGQGISERDLGNIFDRFYQVDRVHPNGSGIGLSLSKAFVELHGGTIEVESILDKGSVFTVTLPVRHISESVSSSEKHILKEEVEAELERQEPEISLEGGKPLVLVIDDNSDIQALVGELLKPHYNIIYASNGAEGIKKAVKYVPDLIICDVMMPVMDGLECCRRLKSELTTSHIPVLMLTACSMDEQRVQGYDNGADGYLSKPFNSAVLLSRCSSLINNRKRILELWQKDSSQVVKAASENNESNRELPATDIDNEFYNRFLTIFKEKMGNSDLTVDSIASDMGLERTQFYRKIKSLTNYTPVELIRNLRLKQARLLLTKTEKNISEIAYEIGFSTPAYFTKCYREAYGETPSETRTGLTN